MASTTKPKAAAAAPEVADAADDSVKPSASFDRSNVFKIAGAAALGVVAGLAAGFGRKFVAHAPNVLAGGWREALTAEHKAVLRLFDLIEATDDSEAGRRTVLLGQIKHMLAKHAFQEENVIYPALRESGDAAEAERLVGDHGEVKHALFELERMPGDDALFLTRLRQLRTSLEVHMQAEEQDLFPALDARLDATESKELSARMNKEGLKLA